MVNFRQPYFAQSLQDFWRRWHISLSTWLRDYLYIPLGGNRKGRIRTYLNLMTTMLLGGLWHGANWTFVIWGGIHGSGLALERLIAGRHEAASARGVLGGVAQAHRHIQCGVPGVDLLSRAFTAWRLRPARRTGVTGSGSPCTELRCCS